MKFSRARTVSTDFELQEQQSNRSSSWVQGSRTPRSSRLKSLTPRLRLPFAILAGSAITAGTTYALVKHVQHLIANAQVSSNPSVWIQKAREDGYGACYDGCDDCHDVNFAYDACEKTARAIVPGINCNGILMWNWADRYPMECLKALGVIYKAEALTRRKQTYRNQLAVIILTVLAGVLGAVLIYYLWGRWFPAQPQPQRWAAAPPPYTYSPQSRRTTRRKKWPFFWRTATTTSFFTTSHAYPCWGFSPSATQYFTSTNTSVSPPISGLIHGWSSSCHQESYVCGSTCTVSGSSSSNGGSSTTCTPETCYRDDEDETPTFFVNWTVPRVEGCGFRLVDAGEVASEVAMRVGNPLLERNWRVKISVSRFNGTDGRTEDAVWCLWDIGNH
ncbi:hypothetical protein ONS95_000204 [Cadophora gregata]|uniref:uncharacterized protein n=1 Tax=Cadophora gregata TaxID=51156 RepID=UPI0026DBD152|nr:uncharacterized protein ONS95_000204 [Cadophora gregata]KAK0115518.1 hypothetical protein ONS96_013971 [Cadophora gregata f. sp. sojae]KAK0128226.1 hypothetical protein ONS95_000204 [Cadophora gregata]